MEWYVLVLILSLPSTTQADCTAQCFNCAQQIADLDMPINSLTCTLECEGVFSSTTELDKCEKALRFYSTSSTGFRETEDIAPSRFEEEQQDASVGNLVKRYGGFIKRIDKNKIFNSPARENAQLKGMFAIKYGNPLGKFGERDVPELSQDIQRADDTSGNENAAINEMKRYGGFLRKFPKRSNSAEESGQEELQKRYGGFMRRIRPKLKWDNQKRYGGFLRRHFKISVRSDEEPSSYDDFEM